MQTRAPAPAEGSTDGPAPVRTVAGRGIPPALDRAAGITWRLVVIAVGVVLATMALARLRIVVLPVLVALLLSTALVPPARWLRDKGLPAALATMAVVFGSLAMLFGVIFLMGVQIGEEFESLGESVSEGIDDVERWLVEGPLDLSERDLDRYVEQARDQLRGSARNLASGAATGAVVVGEIIAGFLLTIVLVFFFVKDGDRMTAWLVDFVPEHRRDLARAMGRRSWATLGGYLRGVAVVGVVDAVLIGIGLAVIGVPLVVPLALLTFLGAFFPLVGATLAGLVAVLVALVSGGPVDALLVGAVVIIVQQVEGDLLAPLVMGRAVQLHPVVVLVALTAGAVLGGVIGAFLAVPVTAVLVGIGTEVRRQGGADVGPSVEEVEDPTAGERP